jgi:receptor protein-tyrosine kinase
MGVSEVMPALRASWWVLAMTCMLGALAGLGLSLAATPLYASTTQLFVSTADSSSSSDALSGSQFSRERVTSYARLMTGEVLAARVVDRLDLERSPLDLAEQIEAVAVMDTVLIDVTVTDPSPVQADRIADAVGAEFAEFVTELESPVSGGVSPVKVTVTDPAQVAEEPSSPRTVLNVAAGGLLGLAVGAGLALLRARLDRSVKDVDVLTELVGAPVVGSISRSTELDRHHVLDRGRGRAAEDYRQLRNALRFLDVDRPPQVLMVSSAVPGEGKTTLVINLAMALAESGRRVAVIEADLRRPKVAAYLDLIDGVGLTNVLGDEVSVEEVVQRYGHDAVFVIASGPLPPNPGQLLASAHMSALLDKLRTTYDVVLIDAPPVLPVADASGLALLADGVLLSVRHGVTRKDEVRAAVARLERVQARLLGAVLNIVPPKAEGGGNYEYRYLPDSGKHAR